MQTTKLTTQTILPLTCSRAGTCCFGNVVMLNPWELFSLSKEKKSPLEHFEIFTVNLVVFDYALMGSQIKKDDKHVANMRIM